MSKFNDAFQGLSWKIPEYYLSLRRSSVLYKKLCFADQAFRERDLSHHGKKCHDLIEDKEITLAAPWTKHVATLRLSVTWSVAMLRFKLSKMSQNRGNGGSWLIWTHSEQFTCDQRFHCSIGSIGLYMNIVTSPSLLHTDEIWIGNTPEKLRYMQLPNFASENLKCVAYLPRLSLPKQTATDVILS